MSWGEADSESTIQTIELRREVMEWFCEKKAVYDMVYS